MPYRIFLFNKDGNPNKRNIHNETALHLLCMGPHIMLPEAALQPRLARPYEDDDKRAECLHLILRWKGAKLDKGEFEKAENNAIDNKKSTPLHYAAASGMKTCVEVIIPGLPSGLNMSNLDFDNNYVRSVKPRSGIAI